MKLQVFSVKVQSSVLDVILFLFWGAFTLCKIFLLTAATTLLVGVGTHRYLGVDYTLETLGYLFYGFFVLFLVVELFSNRVLYLTRKDSLKKENQQ